MKAYPANYTLKVFDLNSSKITEHNLYVERSLHVTNGNVIWKTKFDFNGEVIENENQYFLSESINRIREIIEPKGLRLLVKCSDHDAAHSGMQADMTAGTQIYKLNEKDNQGRFASYDVLGDSDINAVVSLEEQKKNKEAFYNSIKDEKKTVYNSTLPKAGRSWWQKLFGFE